MTRSPLSLDRAPRPVPIRRYRYSKWRWRLLVAALDALGTSVMAAWRRLRPIGPWGPARRILVVQLDHLGDSVLSSPLFPGLRSAFPEASIDVLASPSNRAIFEADPLVDRVVLADRNWFERHPGRWALGTAVWSLGRRLRTGGYDLGIDVRGDVLSVLVLALARIPRRVGWAMGGGGFLLTDIAPWEPGRHEVRSRLALLGAIEGESPMPDEVRVTVAVDDRDRLRIARLLRESWPISPRRHAVAACRPALVAAGSSSGANASIGSGLALADRIDADWLHAGRFGAEAPLLAVHLGAGTPAKRWPIASWDDLIGRFLRDGWRVIAIGGPEDARLADALSPHRNLRDWTGRLRVTETTALLERADLFLGADSGPAHLASSAGVPSVILFSGTNRVGQWRPWSRRSLVLRHKVPCRPCHRKVCPLADHPCMSSISPERVYDASRRWWARLHLEQSPHAPL